MPNDEREWSDFHGRIRHEEVHADFQIQRPKNRANGWDDRSPQRNGADAVKLLINGRFAKSKTTEWRDVVDPATQEVLAVVPFATDAEIEAAVASAKQAFKTWCFTPLAVRARIMLKLQALVREHMSNDGTLSGGVNTTISLK